MSIVEYRLHAHSVFALFQMPTFHLFYQFVTVIFQFQHSLPSPTAALRDSPPSNMHAFHTLRHWKATTLYHQTKDILYVMNFLRHRRIDNTLIYIQLDNAIFGSGYSDKFTVKVAKTLKEACGLVEIGFEYVTEIDSAKIFRKRK